MATLVLGPFYLARAFGLGAAQVGMVLPAGALALCVFALAAGLVGTALVIVRAGK
jgi:hypothetical protein